MIMLYICTIIYNNINDNIKIIKIKLVYGKPPLNYGTF